MKIAVITPVFALAGVPLAQVRFARSLAARGHTVDLMIGRVLAGYSFTPPESLNTKILNQPNVRSLLWPLVQYLWSENPEVVFSAEDHLNTIVLAAAVLSGSRAKISCSSRVTPFDTYSNRKFSKRWILKQSARAVMRRADVLTCVSKDMLKQYQSVFNNAPHHCVYNIVSDGASANRVHEALYHPWLSSKDIPVVIAAGRLAPWKGFADLIDAMALASVPETLDPNTVLTSAEQKELEKLRAQDQREIKALKKELHRNEKAMAEMAALLVLQKKWEHYCLKVAEG